MTETLMSRPLTDPGEALTAAARAAVLAEVERVHHDHECTGLPAGWVALSVPEPCERCGTRVFALRRVDGAGAGREVPQAGGQGGDLGGDLGDGG